jgi:hypothetical protein
VQEIVDDEVGKRLGAGEVCPAVACDRTQASEIE